jgi:hypothetical protein
MSVFEIEYRQQGIKTRLKSQTGPLRPEKYAGHFIESHGFYRVFHPDMSTSISAE